MHPFRIHSAAWQVAEHLRGEVERSRWSERMPGVNVLAAELAVNRKTVEAALQQLEHDGVLRGQGSGRSRLIVPTAERFVRPMRIALLMYDAPGRTASYMVELHHLLMAAGHTAFFTRKVMVELGMDVARIARLVRQTTADAWVIGAGSREVLAWFCAQPRPAFALFGRPEGLPIAAAGPDKPPAFATATRHLIGLGHRRIVLLTRQLRRLPEPGRSERAFLVELERHGIAVGEYHLPNWEETREGFRSLLDSLFRVTPPTALIIDEASFFVATQQFLADRGIRAPQQISLVCTDPDSTFEWCLPSIAHMRWDSNHVVRRIVRWAGAVSKGRTDLRQTTVAADFILGGTIGPVPSESAPSS